MTKLDIFERTNPPSKEEQRLREHACDGPGLTPRETDRLAAISVKLDRPCDLLNQRRALRAGDPADGRLGSAAVVERSGQ
jgi:hypothetical protein